MNNELVSVIMPNYNGSKYIESSINSVISQTYKNWELLIVDDFSNDNSVDIINQLVIKDQRIKLFENERNMGAAHSRNKALNCAQGRWIAFLDSDDLWSDTKLEEQIDFMKKNEYKFSCTEYYVIQENGNVSGNFKINKNCFKYEDILKSNSVGCLTVIFDRYEFPDLKMIEEAFEREDFASWLKFLKDGNNIYVFHKSLSYYRRHVSSSYNKFKMAKYQWLVYRKIEGINIFKSAYYLCSWAINGLFKYRYKKI